MLDFHYSPWLILALVGLIFFRPDDWQDLAFHGGRWVRRVRAYVLEWQEYVEFSEIHEDEIPLTEETDTAQQRLIWPHAVVRHVWQHNRHLSVLPYI